MVDLGATPFGHEQVGLRPGIIVSVQNGIALLIPLTSNSASLRFTSTLPISPSKENGLSTTSIALIFQLRAIDARRIIKTIGTLDTKTTRSINKLLRAITTI